MFRGDLESREAEIIRTISSLPQKFIVLGGYATSALASHKFSVDCDIIISRGDVKEFRSQLKKEGYVKRKSATGFDKVYGGYVEVYSKKVKTGNVSIDLFVESVLPISK